ncbi:MAG: hypothetical protein JW791_02055 [Nanoarchaeota archaeon]|nr:hypothetical protein [Nanoarchaeota archaeon]
MDKNKGVLPIGALVLILIGSLWLAQDMGWLSTSISWWPLLLIVIGIGIIVNNYWKI